MRHQWHRSQLTCSSEEDGERKQVPGALETGREGEASVRSRGRAGGGHPLIRSARIRSRLCKLLDGELIFVSAGYSPVVWQRSK